ncbi:hypothetical protein PENTCL1PPCAC_1195, partial [Pristionchus entomophagus]
MPPRLGILVIFFLLTGFSSLDEVKGTEIPLPDHVFHSVYRPEELLKDWKMKGMREEEVDHDVEFSEEDERRYKEKVRGMFYHAYDGYLHHAYPKDELKPLTCEGHDTWGSFSLTLVDALDTLLVLGNVTEFKRASRLVLQSVRTEVDINVSVFETNIRIVGGLLAAHMLQGMANDTEPGWPCAGSLLSLAHRMGERLLPAFNTQTGMPYGTVNLKYGVHKDETPITCTAGVGTMILEFAALSRLTGDERFEKVATRALDSLFKSKSPINLVGNHINVQTGQWTATDSGIGAGVDSYFEYLVKGALLFRKPRLMKQYYDLEDAILKYVRRGDWFHWVSMASGLTSHEGELFQSLEAFWPGMLTLIGDVGDAYRILMNYADLIEKYGFPPEFWDLKTKEPKGGRDAYPLRPELVESMMYVYRATGDRRILKLAATVVDAIEEFARTPCGYSTVKVKSGEKENRMESFFLAETIKYLYLLFDDDNFLHNSHSGRVVQTDRGSCVVEAGGWIFNTEAHPLDPGIINCCSANNAQDRANIDDLLSDASLSELLDDLLDNLGGDAKITVKSISEDAEALNDAEKSEYIQRQYGSEEIEFEAEAEAAKKQEEEKERREEFFRDEEELKEDEKQSKIAEIVKKWEEKEGKKVELPVELKKPEEKREDQFVKVTTPPPPTPREKRRRQREIEGSSVQIELGRFEWKIGEEKQKEKEEGVRQIDELKRHARALVEQRMKKGVNGSKVSLDVIQALYSITEEKFCFSRKNNKSNKEPLRRLSNAELTEMLQKRSPVERIAWPAAECTACCRPLCLRGDSASYRSMVASMYTVVYRNRGVRFQPGPVCWQAEAPSREDHFMSTVPDVTRYRIHDFGRISVAYTEEAMRETVEQEWDLLAVRGPAFLERLMGDGEVLPRRDLKAPFTHERKQQMGRERLDEDDEMDDITYRKIERKEEEEKDDEEDDWWSYGATENKEEIVKKVFADR